jgi:hypothetical protein
MAITDLRFAGWGWQSKPTGCSWTPEESKVESSEHQDNANIHYQPFPESVSEEHEIYTDYDGDHRHHVKHDSYLSAHFSLPVTSDATTYLSGHKDITQVEAKSHTSEFFKKFAQSLWLGWPLAEG